MRGGEMWECARGVILGVYVIGMVIELILMCITASQVGDVRDALTLDDDLRGQFPQSVLKNSMAVALMWFPWSILHGLLAMAVEGRELFLVPVSLIATGSLSAGAFLTHRQLTAFRSNYKLSELVDFFPAGPRERVAKEVNGFLKLISQVQGIAILYGILFGLLLMYYVILIVMLIWNEGIPKVRRASSRAASWFSRVWQSVSRPFSSRREPSLSPNDVEMASMGSRPGSRASPVHSPPGSVGDDNYTTGPSEPPPPAYSPPGSDKNAAGGNSAQVTGGKRRPISPLE